MGFGYGWFRALLYNPAFATVVPVRGAVFFAYSLGCRRQPGRQNGQIRFETVFQGERGRRGRLFAP